MKSRGDWVVPWAEAKRLKARNARARWRDIAQDLDGEVWPQIEPGFRIRPGQSVFTIGSCFARNIERHLALLGCRVPMLDFTLPADEWDGQPNSALNKFHPPSFRQSLEWAAAIRDRDGKVAWTDCEPLAYQLEDGRFYDLDMNGAGAVGRERFLERRQQIFDVLSAAFQADCVMMTPGLIEAWRDRSTGLFIHGAPTLKKMAAERERWELAVLSYETCFDEMLAAIDVVRARNPAAKILITTSPVPMEVTFSGKDIRIANAQSKAVLRAVCGAAALERPLVDYFPSYESVTLSFPTGVWKADRLHVSQGFIGKIVAHMLDNYLEGVDDAARSYQRAVALVAEGQFGPAEAAAREAIAVRPNHAEARAILGEALLRQGRTSEAAAEFSSLLAGDPSRADLKIGLARAIGADPAGLDEALALLEAVMDESAVTLADLLAVFDFIRKRALSAAASERVLRRALELYPLHLQVHQPLIELLVAQGRTGEAIAALEHATGVLKPEASLYVQLGRLLLAEGRRQEAARAAELALHHDPRNKDAAGLMAKTSTASARAGASGPALPLEAAAASAD